MQFTLVGEVIAIEAGNGKLEGNMVITLDVAGEDAPRTILVSNKYWVSSRMDLWLKEETVAHCTMDKTIAGKTTFINADGVVTLHTKSSDHLAKIRKASKRMFLDALATAIETQGKYADITTAQATIISAILSR
jgi:hypothetical protein